MRSVEDYGLSNRECAGPTTGPIIAFWPVTIVLLDKYLFSLVQIVSVNGTGDMMTLERILTPFTDCFVKYIAPTISG
jgi:hypothetical protein